MQITILCRNCLKVLSLSYESYFIIFLALNKSKWNQFKLHPARLLTCQSCLQSSYGPHRCTFENLLLSDAELLISTHVIFAGIVLKFNAKIKAIFFNIFNSVAKLETQRNSCWIFNYRAVNFESFYFLYSIYNF